MSDTAMQRTSSKLPDRSPPTSEGTGRASSPWYAAAIMIPGFIGVVLWNLLVPARHVTTDDAYVAAHYAVIAPRIDGRVATVIVHDNQTVKGCEVLATLDDHDELEALDRATAMLARDSALAEATNTAVQRQSAIIAGDRAKVDSALAEIEFAKSDADRYRYLARTGASTVQRRQRSETTMKHTEAQLTGARAALLGAGTELDVLRAQAAALHATVAADKSAVSKAVLNLGYTRIRSRFAGTVGQLAIAAGDYVAPGKALMALVPLGEIYIIANYREIALRRVRPGQPVRIHVDAYGVTLRRRVDSIAPASGATFSPIPAENATGNFNKIVRRLPVKIALTPHQPNAALLRVGLSVETDIDTSTGARS